MPSPIKKYLARYAEQEARQLAGFPSHYRQTLCVPAFDEAPDFIERLWQFLQQQPHTLAIVVLNQPRREHGENANNRACQRAIEKNSTCLWQSAALSLQSGKHSSDILLVDRYRNGRALNDKQGVGLARKIAADIATALISQGNIERPWLFSSDADVDFPATYFDAIEHSTVRPDDSVAAYLFPFAHIPCGDRAIDSATALYQQRLDAYVSGLQFAGSPYAFHTLGSTLAVQASHYAAVRGFPRRAAGEDFYLLNKLRKTGQVVSLPQPQLAICSRQSTRAPFGTGAAVNDLLQQSDPSSAAIFYHPRSFLLLRELLQWLPQYAEACFSQQLSCDWKQHLKTHYRHRQQLPLVYSALKSIGFANGLQHSLKQSRDAMQFKRQMDSWMDGFRTMKWLHCLRDQCDHGLPENGDCRHLNAADYQRECAALDIAAVTLR